MAKAPSRDAPAASTLRAIRSGIRALGDPGRAEFMKRFFRTGPGEYGEGDRFLGLTVPQTRQLAKRHRGAQAETRLALLESAIHEERLLGLLLMVQAYEKGDAAIRKAVFEDYLAHRDRVNNWDLVDGSAPNILGAYLLEEGGLGSHPGLLESLAASGTLWDRRIAILATFRFIKQGRFDWTLRLAERLLGDREDLIHKGVGWMLREVGERDRSAEEAFLRRHCRAMPRTMLRYAIEKFPERLRKAYLAGTAGDFAPAPRRNVL